VIVLLVRAREPVPCLCATDGDESDERIRACFVPTADFAVFETAALGDAGIGNFAACVLDVALMLAEFCSFIAPRLPCWARVVTEIAFPACVSLVAIPDFIPLALAAVAKLLLPAPHVDCPGVAPPMKVLLLVCCWGPLDPTMLDAVLDGVVLWPNAVAVRRALDNAAKNAD
jgi:hypothetical protein